MPEMLSGLIKLVNVGHYLYMFELLKTPLMEQNLW
jgi:hypothetical protein